jgi:hypothetical protein
MKLSAKAVKRVAGVFAGVDLGDPRRNARLERTLQLLAAAPDSPLPEAMGGDSKLKGAYRLLNSEFVDATALNAQHAVTTAERAKKAGCVFAIHDTTQFEFSHADAEAVGYLNTGKAGFRLHYALIVDATDTRRRPLGVANAEAIFRDRPPRKRRKKRGRSSKSGPETVRDEQRKSLRWSRGFAKVGACLEGANLIHLADREGDNYELLGRAVQAGQRFVIRVRVPDRRVRGENGQSGSVRTVIESCKGLLTREVPISTRRKRPEPQANKTHPPRAARIAELEFSATSVAISRPRYHRADLPAELSLNVVRVFEPKAPEQEKPIEWLLFTTEPVSTPEEVAAVVDAYRARWLIEECNKAIKTGCSYEQRQLESRHALLTLLAITLPIACEVLWLRSRAREGPDRPAQEVLTPTQIEVLRVLGPRKLGLAPTIHDALWAVAALGGHLKSNGEPGWQILHRGMIKLLAYEEAWIAAHHGRRRAPYL